MSSTIEAKAESLPGGENIVSAARTAANAIGSAADYMRDHDVRGMVTSMRDSMKRHPGVTLLVATALGFLIARAFSRD